MITTLMSNGRPGREASSVAELVKPTTEFIVVPPDPVEAYAATDLLDVLDGVQAPATVVVRLPVKLRRLLGQAVVEPAPAPHL